MAKATSSRNRRIKAGIAAGALALSSAVLAPGIASAQDAPDTGSAEQALEFLNSDLFGDLLQLLLDTGSAGGEADE